MDALREKNIPYYNPRSRALLDQEEVAAALGAFLEIIDPQRQAQGAIRLRGIQNLADGWRSEYSAQSTRYPALSEYVDRAAAAISTMGPASSVGCNMIELLYHILSYEPFVGWIEDAERSKNIGVVTQVFEAFSKVPPRNNPRRMMGDLYTSQTPGGGVSFTWRKRLYYSLLGILAGEGLNEPEDQEDDLPTDRLPIMTIHQAKGLQFPIVFVSSLSPARNQLAPGTGILLERDLSQFRMLPYPGEVVASPDEKATQDLVRSYFVAFSRAQCSLILSASNTEISRGGVGLGPNQEWLRRNVQNI
jgi:DNA helicase-2/ATP-dependent DNA helicase PcrA